MPKVDVIDRDDEVYVRAEMPGVDKKDIDISMTGNLITLKSSSRKEEKGKHYHGEMTQGDF